MLYEFRKTLLIGSCLAGLGVMCLPGSLAWANPEDGVVAAGSATITASGKTLDVYQSSDRAVIDWRSFDIRSDEKTQFHQPSSSSIVLNRVKVGNPSQIDGQLTANGHIVIINPNGVFFSGTSRVDVGSLTATSADIDNDRFMQGSGRLDFDRAGNRDAGIVNAGLITVKDAGLVTLVAPHVENHGVIEARLGKVSLASGETFTLDMAGDDLLKVAVDERHLQGSVVNTGAISADGGQVALTAAAARDIVDALIVNTGVIEAKTLSKKNGKIVLGAAGSNKTAKSGSSTIINTGVLDASGRGKDERGGSIEVLGDNIALGAGSIIDASGYAGIAPSAPGNANGTATMTADGEVRGEDDFLSWDSRAGGSIKIGGDYLGRGETQTAKNLYVDENALTLNDAVQSGDGGRTIFWSDGETDFRGLVLGRGGIEGGNGGFVETSGKETLHATGFADLENRSDGYDKGTYLLDPANITIYGNVDPAFVSTDSSINLNANLKLWLDASDTSKVNLTYNSLGTTATGTSGTNTITVSANTGLVVGARIRLSGAGSVTAASTVGADTYTVSAIAGTTITLSSNLTTGYAGSAIYQGYVSQLTDKSTQANNATQSTAGNMPLWISNGQNGLGVSTYDGSNDYLSGLTTNSGTTLGAFASFTMNNNSTVYARVLSLASSINGLDWNNTSSSAAILRNNGTTGLTSYRGGGSGSTGTTSYGVATIAGSQYNGVNNNLYVNGAAGTASASSGSFSITDYRIGSAGNGDAQYWGGIINETILYSTSLLTETRNLVEQYQSGKWGIALDPLAGAGTEVAEATASTQKGDGADGYSVFTTRYLERLSQSANIALQSSNNITLDFKGDTLALSTSGRSLSLTAGNQITTASAGTITTNNGAISLTGTNGIVFSHDIGLDTNGGNLTFNNNVTLGANQTGWTSDAGTTTFSGTVNGGYNLTSAAGTYSFASAFGGVTPLAAVSLTSTNSLTLPSITAASILARTTGATSDITIPSGKALTASGAGTPLTVAAARNVINSAGSGALAAASGRWLVYSTNPASDTIGSLSNAFRRFSCTYGGACPTLGAGNGLLYSYTPTLTITPSTVNVTYGDAVPALTGYSYGLTGYLGSDSSDDSITGALNGGTTYTQGSNVGTYNINHTGGALSSDMGYGFTYANNASALVVAKKALNGTVNDQTLAYGDAAPTYGKTDVTWAGLYGPDTVADLTSATIGLGGYTQGSNAGAYTLNASALSATNYSLGTVTDGTLTVAKKALDGTVNDQTLAYGAAAPTYGKTDVSWTGFYNTDTVADLTSATIDLGGYVSGGASGDYALSATTLIATNYQLGTVNDGVLSIGAAPVAPGTLLPPTVEQTISRTEILFPDIPPTPADEVTQPPSALALFQTKTEHMLADLAAAGTLKIDDTVKREFNLCVDADDPGCSR